MGRGGGEKIGGWIAIGGGEGGVGGLDRLRAAESWWKRSRVLSSWSLVFTWISGSKASSSEGGEGLGVESEGLLFRRKPQRGLEGGCWEMVEIYNSGSLDKTC